MFSYGAPKHFHQPNKPMTVKPQSKRNPSNSSCNVFPFFPWLPLIPHKQRPGSRSPVWHDRSCYRGQVNISISHAVSAARRGHGSGPHQLPRDAFTLLQQLRATRAVSLLHTPQDRPGLTTSVRDSRDKRWEIIRPSAVLKNIKIIEIFESAAVKMENHMVFLKIGIVWAS